MKLSYRPLFLVCGILFFLVLLTAATSAQTKGKKPRRGDDPKATSAFEDNDRVTMTKDEISKVSGEALADASETKLNNLNDDQLGGVGESLIRSKNTAALNNVMKKLSKDKAIKLASKMAKSGKKLSRKAKANIVKDLKQKLNGDFSTLSKDSIKDLGPSIMKEMKNDDIKKMAKNNKESFKALTDELSKTKDISPSKRKAVADGAKSLFGEADKWDKDAVGRFGKFARPNDLEKLKPESIKGAVEQLGKDRDIDNTTARKMMSNLKGKDGLGSPQNWNASTLKKLGELTKGLKTKDFKKINPAALRDSMIELGKVKFSKSQARAVIDKIVADRPTDRWTKDDLKNAGNLTEGLSPKDMRKLSKDAVEGALPKLKEVSHKFTQEQKRELAEKIESPSNWTMDKVKEVGNLCYGKSSKKLKELSANVANDLVKSMIPEKSAPEAKNRVIKLKVFSAGKVDLTVTGPVINVVTLNELKNTDVKKELGLDKTSLEKIELPFKQEQARQLIEKFKEVEGEPDTWDAETPEALSKRSLLRGLSKDDLSKLKTNLPLEELSDEIGLLPGQRKGALEAFKANKGIKKPEDFSGVTEDEIKSMAGLAAELSDEELENLPKEVGKQALKQIGEKPKLERKPRDFERVMKILERTSVEDLTVGDILDLGNFICDLTADKIAEIKTSVFNATRYNLGEKKCFGSEQLKALAKKAKEVKKPESMTDDDLPDFGCILEGLPAEDLRKIKDTVIQDNLDSIGKYKLSSEQAKVVMEKVAKPTSRRRRSTDVSTKKGSELIEMGNLLLGLTASDIATVTNDAFDEAASNIGKIDGFTQQQLEAWAAKAKQAWNSNPAMFTENQLLKLGAIAIGFSDNELGSMALSSDDVIESLGSQKVKSVGAVGYTPSQLSKALNKIRTLKGKSIAQFSAAEISNLKNFALALTVDEIASIPKETFGNCIGSLGALNGWSADQMKKLKEKAVEAHGPVSEWSVAKLRESGNTIGGFSSSELQSLSSEHVSVVTPEAIKSMPPSLFGSFSSAQLQELDYSQASAVSDEQMQALPEDLRNILETKKGAINPDNSGAGQVYLSQVFLAMILSTAVMINF